MSEVPRLLLLTDRSQLRLGRGLVATIAECVGAGLTHVVVREHDLTPDARSALIRTLADVPGLTVLSSRILDACAAGLHLPATRACNAVSASLNTRSDACEVTPTPRYIPGGGRARALWGRSCHSAEEVRRAAQEGVDYVTLSPYAATPSKPGYGPPLPRDAYAGHALPVLALGGITPANAAQARAEGAHGVAVMGAVMRAAEPAAVVEQLLEALR